MNIVNHIRAGARLAPALTLILYYSFVLLDIYTTFLASPDLKYEGNWVIRHFNLNWSQIIIKDILYVSFITLSVLIALSYIHKIYNGLIIYHSSFVIEALKLKKVLICIIALTFFYTHFYYSAFLIINNYLHYIYIYKIENSLTPISSWYINRVILIYSNIFIFYRFSFIIIALVISFYKVKKLRNKYRSKLNSI